jgi:dinuclear metal center YbgI/SA1388 family protein
MILIKQLTSFIESLFPLAVQEEYDNSGLLIGRYDASIDGALVCLNVTEEVVNEAIQKKCNLIISHHPMIFSGLKRLIGSSKSEILTEQCVKNNIHVYAIHTNADKAFPGINSYIAGKLGLVNTAVLVPEQDILRKLVVYCPSNYSEQVRKALFEAGAGVIGAYDNCSFNTDGYGTFRGSEISAPFVGVKGEQHTEAETRIETVFPLFLQRKIINALIDVHPYEEVAYDIFRVENEHPGFGFGASGKLEKPMKLEEFLKKVKAVFGAHTLKYSGNIDSEINTVAVCGGSGAGFIGKAYHSGAEVYITSDIKYHEFDHGFENFVLIDAGHFETEIFFREYIITELTKKFTNFAIHFSEREKNWHSYF